MDKEDDFTHMWNLKRQNKQNEAKTNRGEGDTKIGEMDEGGHCVVMDGNQTWHGDHFVVYRDVELQCCTPEIYITKKR